jgi:hypothetical protein
MRPSCRVVLSNSNVQRLMMFFFYFSLSCVLFDETQKNRKSPNYRRATVSLSSTTVGRWNSCGRWVIQNNQTSIQTHAIFVVFFILFLIFVVRNVETQSGNLHEFFRHFSVAFVSVSVSVSVFRDRTRCTAIGLSVGGASGCRQIRLNLQRWRHRSMNVASAIFQQYRMAGWTKIDQFLPRPSKTNKKRQTSSKVSPRNRSIWLGRFCHFDDNVDAFFLLFFQTFLLISSGISGLVRPLFQCHPICIHFGHGPISSFDLVIHFSFIGSPARASLQLIGAEI